MQDKRFIPALSIVCLFVCFLQVGLFWL